MKARTHLLLAGLAGATAVAAGAIAAHVAGVGAAEPLQTAVRYHVYHALALLALAALAAQGLAAGRFLAVAAWCFLGGIVLFSGGIYLHAALGTRALGFVVPAGGLAFIAGWLAIAWGAIRGGGQ